MTLTQIDSQTQTAPYTGVGIDTSGITGDWTLKLNVSQLSDSGSAVPLVRFVFEDSINGFTASLSGPAVSFKGALVSSADKVKSFKKQDFPDLRLGVAGATLRLKLSNIEAGGSCTYRAWLES
jgi:hypothetical protein